MWFRLSLLFIAIKAISVEKSPVDSTTLNKGHLKSIGYQGTSLGVIPEMKYSPNGQYFYEHFIKRRRPLVIRNAASHWLAVKNWPNETYLNETYGNVPFTIKMEKIFNNTLPVQKDYNLSQFLESYKTQSIYLDSSFPETNMINELNLPPLLACHEIFSTISDIYLLMNAGNSSSALHHDGYENILAVISGTKKILIFNSSYSDNVYADDFTILPGLSPINPNNVDLEKFPKFADVSFYESTLNAGDILYIPQYWWHHVYSEGSPNIAINIWFGMFNYEKHFEAAGVLEEKDVVKVSEMFDKLVQEESNHIDCQEQSPALDQVLKVVLEDSSSETLRIPKVPERPADFKLASGYTMPPLGFGTAALRPEDTMPALLSALGSGYRLFDSAQIYGTEAPLAEAIKQSKIPRSDIIIVTKLHPQYHGYESTIASVEESLRKLQTDYIDVFLIHTKQCNAGYFKCPQGIPEGMWQDSWRAMELLNKQGKIRSLGVSNFDVIDLKELLNITTVPVSVVQNWFDPFHQEVNVRQFCAYHGIHFMGYSTLGSQWTSYGGMDRNPVLDSLPFFEIASHHEFVVAQVILRWAIHLNVTVIPRSRDPRHILLNFNSLNIELTESEIKTITDEWLPGGTEDPSEADDIQENKEEPEGLGTGTETENLGADLQDDELREDESAGEFSEETNKKEIGLAEKNDGENAGAKTEDDGRRKEEL